MASFDIDILSGSQIVSAIGTTLLCNRTAIDPFYPYLTTPPGLGKDFCVVSSGDGALTQLASQWSLPTGAFSFELEFAFYGDGEARILINNQAGNEFDLRFSAEGITVNDLRLSGSTRYVDGSIWTLRFASTDGVNIDIYGNLDGEESMLRRYSLGDAGAPSSGYADGAYIEVVGSSQEPSTFYVYTWRFDAEAILPSDLPVAAIETDEEALVGTVHIVNGEGSYSPVVPKTQLTYRWTIESRPPGSDALLFGHEGASATSPQNITFVSRKPKEEGEGLLVQILPIAGEPGADYPLELRLGVGTIEVHPARLIDPEAPYDVTYLSTEDDLVSAITDTNHPSFNAEVSDLVQAIGGSTDILDFYTIELVNGMDSRKASPFFIPDVDGVYTFKLVVTDGVDQSNPVQATVVARPIVTALGEVPDASYFWRHLPADFWGRVQNREWIETFWSCMIQIVGADLLQLWNEDANRNLSTIQPSFQKRWLGYASWFTLSSPGDIVSRDETGTGWLTTTGDITGDLFGKLLTKTFYAESAEDIRAGDVLISAVDGSTHEVAGYKHPVATLAGDGVVCGDLVVSGVKGSTSPYDSQILTLTSERAPGAAVDDFLWVQGAGYRITAASIYALTVDRPLPSMSYEAWEVIRPRTTFDWAIPSYFTSEQETDAGDKLEITRFGVTSQVGVLGSTGTKIAIDAGEYDVNDKPRRIRRRSRLPFPEGLLHIPTMRGGGAEYKHGTDYTIGDEHVEFNTPTDFPEYLFAEVSYFSNDSAVEDNFGRVVGLTKEDLVLLGVNERYLSIVRGLTFAFIKGPTLANIESAIGMIVGLPFTEEDGLILEIDPLYEPGKGRILIEGDSGVVYSYFYKGEMATNPSTGVAYAMGDAVSRFTKLTTGVEILDYLNAPGWFGLLVRAGVISDPEQIFVFEVRLDASVIADPQSLESAVRIARELKPAYTDIRFATYTSTYEEIDVEDDVKFRLRMFVEDNPHVTPYDVGWPHGYSYNLDHVSGDGQTPFQLDMNPYDFPEAGDAWGGEDLGMLDRILDCGPRAALDIQRVFDFRKIALPDTFGVLDAAGLPRFDSGFTFDDVNELGLPDYWRGFHWYFDTPPTTEYLQDPATGAITPLSSNPLHGLFRVFPRVDPRRDDPYLAVTTPIVSELQEINLTAGVTAYFDIPVDGTILYYWLTVYPTDTEIEVWIRGIQAGLVPALSSELRFPVAIPRNHVVGFEAAFDCTFTVKLEYPTPRYASEPWPYIASVVYEDLGATYRIHVYGYLFNVDWGGPDTENFATLRVGTLNPTVGYVTRTPSYISADFNAGDHVAGDYDVVVSNPFGKSNVRENGLTIP